MCDATSAVYESFEVDNCNLLIMEDIKELSRTKQDEKLWDLMQTPNWLAFYDIDFGGLPGGVFTAACPPEALHSLENGLINHCLKELFEKVLSSLSRRQLDTVVQEWILYPKQRHLKNYATEFPRLLFPDGVTSIADISAGTKVGILFAVVIAALTKDGKNVFQTHANLTTKKYNDMIEAFEMLLCYWAWLKKDEYWDCNDMKALECAKIAICKTVNQLVHLFPRSTGSQWNIPKLHEQLHIAHNIHLWGSHKNIHTGPQEHNHIDNAKKLVNRTSKKKLCLTHK